MVIYQGSRAASLKSKAITGCQAKVVEIKVVIITTEVGAIGVDQHERVGGRAGATRGAHTRTFVFQSGVQIVEADREVVADLALETETGLVTGGIVVITTSGERVCATTPYTILPDCQS